VLPKDYGGISHGYVVTSHASQGKTVDKVLIALGSESFSAANKEQFYVSVSRGREGVRLYTDDKAAMMEAVQGSAARLSATELMQSAPAKPKPTLTQRLIRSGVIQRAYPKASATA
jgi:ATP-dependent exoDNAse (exonuclease V) alpha subunit